MLVCCVLTEAAVLVSVHRPWYSLLACHWCHFAILFSLKPFTCVVISRCERLEEQLNDLTELHQNEILNLKQELASMEEKIAYQSYERARDIQVGDRSKNPSPAFCLLFQELTHF